MIPVAYTTFNHYFIKKRVVMMSVAQTLIGIGTMVYPIMVSLLMDKYGFRGSMTVIAALNSHSILGMLVMHPVNWHCKYVKVPIDESKPCKLLFCITKFKKSRQMNFTIVTSFLFQCFCRMANKVK